jgi:hypothetical protein
MGIGLKGADAAAEATGADNSPPEVSEFENAALDVAGDLGLKGSPRLSSFFFVLSDKECQEAMIQKRLKEGKQQRSKR